MFRPALLVVIASCMTLLINAQMPSGAIAIYKLDNSATDISSNAYNGSLTSTTATANRLGISNAATAFTAGSSTGSLPPALVTAISNNFTIGFWFRSTMTAGSGTHWYEGRSLIDAEVCGVSADWGTALIDGGRVCFGIGNADRTIKSTSSTYNDGNWHFVTATRNMAGGTIILYVDGVQVASATGVSTSPLTAPANLRFGSNPCVPTGVFTGALDDLVFYNRVLTGTEVSNLYSYSNQFVLPLNWISFTVKAVGKQAKLEWQVESVVNHDHFVIEHSTNGSQFSSKTTLTDASATTLSPGKFEYNFTDNGLASGIHYYRIRQVDRDGRSTLSKTLQVRINTNTGGYALGSNPVSAELVLINENRTVTTQLTITDLSGRTVLTKKISSTDAVIKTDVSQLQPGYYLLKISGPGMETTLPWIKQ